MEKNENNSKAVGTIDIQKRGEFLNNLIFKPNRRNSDSKPKEKIDIGFDLTGKQNNTFYLPR